MHWHVRTVDVDQLECVVGNDSCERDLLVCGWICFFEEPFSTGMVVGVLEMFRLCSGTFGLTSKVLR